MVPLTDLFSHFLLRKQLISKFNEEIWPHIYCTTTFVTICKQHTTSFITTEHWPWTELNKQNHPI